MVAQASLANLTSGHDGHQITSEERTASAVVRTNPVLKMRATQEVLFKIITGAVRWHNGEEVIDIPAREIASCSVALCKVEDRIRMNLGKANPAPVKAEPRAQSRQSRSSRVLVESDVVQPAPIQIPPAV